MENYQERKSWYLSGQCYQHILCQNGKPEEYKTWHENGRLWAREFFQDKEREGEYKIWYENGKPRVQSFFRNGERDGIHKHWHENGQLTDHEFYRNGELADAHFSSSKTRSFLLIFKHFREHVLSSLNQMLISDLIKLTSQF